MVKLADRAVALAGAQRSERSDEQVRVLTWRGAELVELTEALLQSLENAATNPGLFVHEVDEASDLFKQGLRKEMVIVKCNGRNVQTIEDLVGAESAARRRLRLNTEDGHVVVISKD
jgi:S1-C subfamily serine protease